LQDLRLRYAPTLTMAFEDDDLGDLSGLMGDDYGHGYADDDGDPNVKPKEPPAPSVKNAQAVTQTSISVIYPPQKQFLTKLVIQCLPVAMIPPAEANPFGAFATTAAAGGRIVQPEDPVKSDNSKFESLESGVEYIFRLVATNPSGTAYGKPSKPFITMPATPPAPDFAYASAKSVSIKFPAQGPTIAKLGIEMAVWCAEPFAASNKKKGLLTDTSKHIGTRTTGLVRNLHPGRPYVFRLVVTNRAGTVNGPASKPIKTLPKAPPPPREDTAKRTDTTIGLKFAEQGDGITKLTLQYAILAGKSTFDDIKKNGGKEMTLPDAQTLTEYTVKRLTPDKNYVFRLIAHNASGKSTGQIMGPIKTVTYTPDMLDKSGWLFEVAGNSKKTLGRRLSSRKSTSAAKFWYTIDGKLLSWSDKINGEEVGFLHLGKVAEVTLQGNVVDLKLKGAKAKSITLMGNSDDPNQTNEQLMETWKNSFTKAITGEVAKELQAASAAKTGGKKKKKKKKPAAIQADKLSDDEDEPAPAKKAAAKKAAAKPAAAADDDDSDDDDGGGFGDADEDDEEEGGFGDHGMEESDDESDDGGFGDESDDEVGFGEAESDDDDFGGAYEDSD